MTGQLLAAYQAWPLLFWVFGSVVVYALASNAAWLLIPVVDKRGGHLPGYGRWLAEVSALLFFVGVPYLALGGWPLPPFSGLLSPADLGAAGLGGDWPAARWLESAGTGLALGLAAAATFAIAWGLANRGDSRLGLPPQRGWQLPVHGLYREVHWAFYRAALIVTLPSILAPSSPGSWAGHVYAGTWGGLVLVLLEWSLNPAWRSTWRDPERAALPWLGLGLALLSTLLFLLTRNLWICIGVHWLVSGAFSMVARTQAIPSLSH